MIDLAESHALTLNRDQFSVYSCLCYFSVFNHPLTIDEISDYCTDRLTETEVQAIISNLLEKKIVFRSKGFYSLIENCDAQIAKRVNCEKWFHKKRKTIQRFASFVARFPYVEAVALSGSCSKGLLDKDADVDFFVITTPNKLWLCRTMLILFKKIFLLNSKKYFCLNYFVDVNSLEIPDKNIFVASEIKTLTPVSNKELFDTFLKANNWTDEFLPNKNYYNQSFLQIAKPRKIVFAAIEKVFNNRVGETLDSFCFRLTVNVWKKKFAHLASSDFDLNFRSKKDVSKHHPRAFQEKVLNELNKKLEQIKVI